MNTEQYATSNTVNSCKHYCGIKCVSWSAILAGAIVAIGLSFLLSLFSTAIGLSIYKVSPEGVNTLTASGIVAFAIGIISSMFFSGWVAGYFGRTHCDQKCCGGLYGFAAWSLALILTILLAAPFTHFVTNYTNYLSNTVATTVTTAPETIPRSERTATVTVPNEQALGELSKGAFVLFVLFLLGALASTCGGHVGVHGCHNKACCSPCKCEKCCRKE